MAKIQAMMVPTNRSPLIIAILLFFGLSLLAVNLYATKQLAGIFSLVSRAEAYDLDAIGVLYETLPRFVVALAAGGLLGLATALLQQALQNPLAEPGTLGLLSAARFAVATTLIWFPAIAGLGWPVFIGCGVAAAAVLGLSAFRNFSPPFIILTGMILGLCLDAATSLLILTHFEELGELMIWQSGSLIQDNWRAAIILPSCLVVAGLATFLLRRPLACLDLGDTSLRGIGLSPAMVRGMALTIAITTIAVVTVETGVIAFIGLAGTALASTLGSRTFAERTGFSALIGGALLLATDQAVQSTETILPVPTGTVTALFAAPILLAILRKLRTARSSAAAPPPTHIAKHSATLGYAAIAALLLVTILGLTVGRTPDGLTIATGQEWPLLLELRWPRLLAAIAAGGLLAFGGTIMQRMTGNDLASPELLGVSSGAALVMVPIILLLPPLGRSATMLIASAGSFACLLLSLRISARSGFAPERLLLSGLAVTTLSGSLLSVIAFLGDPRLIRLFEWFSGSTYKVAPLEACIAAAILAFLLAVSLFLDRWLRLLQVGEPMAVALGLRLKTARLALVLLTAVATGTATVMIGPVSFVGLIAPHLARILGFRTPIAHLFAAACLGATMMGLSDWLGRVLAFPWELPAGLVVTVVGAILYAGIVGRR